MDLEKVRNMSDEELTNYLNYLQSKSSKNCAKCYKKETGYSIYIRKDGNITQTRKLCNICEDCYKKLLNDLSVRDIDWY